MSEISGRILSLMRSLNMSYGDLSVLTKIPKSALQRYATGETEKIPLDRLETIARSLHASPAYLMGWESAAEELKQSGLSIDAVIEELDISPETFISILESDDPRDIDAVNKIVKVAKGLARCQKEKAPALTKKDERDIEKRLEAMIGDLEGNADGLMFSGEPMDEETRELLKMSLRNQLEISKRLAKQKYTPKKYRKEGE